MTLAAAATQGSPIRPRVPGGQPSSIFVAGGNGGPSGDGGIVDISVLIGVSRDSEGQEQPVTALIEIANGSNGGRAPDANALGGNGGELAIRANKNTNIRVVNAFRGGVGWDGCQAQPKARGTRGGNGGRLTEELPLPVLVARAFDGGQGGDFAVAPGPLGGNAGTRPSGPIGRVGTPGRPCGDLGLMITLTHNIVVNNVPLAVAGQVVPLSRFKGYQLMEHQGGCDHPHIHGSVYFDDLGPIDDPLPAGCGHGFIAGN